MIRYLLKRIIILILLLIAISTVVFFFIHLIPGDPVIKILGQGANLHDIRQLRHQLSLDKPLLGQYLDFLSDLANLSLGHSLFNHQSVARNIIEVFPYTVYLAISSIILALILSFFFGILAAFNENTILDTTITFFSSIGQAIPNFFLGPLLIIFFSIQMHWFPVSGADGIKYIILPTLTLATSMGAFLTRIIKNAILSEIKKPYILLANAKGLSNWQIFRRHILKNAMIPIITALGMQTGALLTGTIITETIFSWPGLGTILMRSIRQRDFPMVQGIIIFFAFIYLFVTFLVDLTYFWLDPRIKNEYKNF